MYAGPIYRWPILNTSTATWVLDNDHTDVFQIGIFIVSDGFSFQMIPIFIIIISSSSVKLGYIDRICGGKYTQTNTQTHRQTCAPVEEPQVLKKEIPFSVCNPNGQALCLGQYVLPPLPKEKAGTSLRPKHDLRSIKTYACFQLHLSWKSFLFLHKPFL